MKDDFVSHPRFELAGARKFQDGLTHALKVWEGQGGFASEADLLLDVQPEVGKLGAWLFHLPDGTPVGRLTTRSKVGTALAAGQGVARAQVNSVSPDDKQGGMIIMRVTVWTGSPGSIYTPPVHIEPTYLAPVVGEQYHVEAVGKCRAGEPVTLVHEQGNPHDPLALAVLSVRGECVGYIPRDHWLRRAVMEDRRGCYALIREIIPGQKGRRQIVLSAQLRTGPVGTVYYGAPQDIDAMIYLFLGIAAMVIGMITVGLSHWS